MSYKISMDIAAFEDPDNGEVHVVRLFQGEDCIVMGGGADKEAALMVAQENIIEMLSAITTSRSAVDTPPTGEVH
jgi:hypothetical protein